MIAATLLVLAVAPLLVLRGRTLAAYYGTLTATWFLAWLLSLRLRFDDPFPPLAAIAVLDFAVFALFLANGRNVRWSANRAALVAAFVYALLIPPMLRAPIDGDEPYYLLITESIVRDFDLDLANQYGPKRWGRDDLVPQPGDPRGPNGEQYSRHEPFLSLLMVPGYLLGGLPGAVATIALFGVLLVRSTIRWMEDEGISDDAARKVFPLFAFAPPVLFYATRIWPEVPAAFFFVEALRGVRDARPKRWLPALLGLVMLKLRFVLVAIGVVASSRRKLALLVLLVPIAVIWLITGDPTNVHTWRELVPTSPMLYLTGLGGLIADGMSGIAFQAPFYLFSLLALARWKHTPRGFRIGVLASLLYLFYLAPRAEWFGGWAPPLRYIVFLMPVLAVGIASVWERIGREAIALVSAWTIGLVMYGVAYPWRLFHEFTGENAIGELLSTVYRSDFSRMFPSFIRLNHAAWWWLAAILVVTCGAAAFRPPAGGLKPAAPLVALLMALGFRHAQKPGPVVHLEDAHVQRDGGEIYPKPYTLLRTTYRGGWVFESGDSATFLARAGTHTLHYITGLGATFEVGGQAYTVPPRDEYRTIRVTIPRSGPVTLRCLAGAINIDKMELND